MAKIFIDEQPFEVEDGLTVFQAAKQNGIDIPHLCYHPAFPPEGTCRMCLVEIEGVPKLELACAAIVRDGMKVSTLNEKVAEARKGVLEFLLAEHPIDCPICDQAGECKLQDYYEEYGMFESKFRENKEKYAKKTELGKNLIHDQERCVLCRRCVRFLRDVTKTEELGVFERGIHAEVNIYDENPVSNNYSGNLAQICPVGAITDKDFRFQTRSWFLDSGASICPVCSRGCSISIDYHKGFARFQTPKRVYRIRARHNPDINGHWICDLGRYGYSFLNEARLENIVGPDKKKDYAWKDIISDLADKLIHLRQKATNISMVLYSWLTNEELFLIKKIFQSGLGVERFYFADLSDKEEGDDFLLTADRNPNRRGAAEVGFDLNPPNLKNLANDTDMILVFGSFLARQFEGSELKPLFENISHKILLTPRPGEFNDLFDYVLPVATIPEKSGSLTNVDGITQDFDPVLESVGDSRAEWEILVDLAKAMNLDFYEYNKFSSPSVIREEMGEEIPFFRK
ncbi:2Fe-2S iron-sulfur cluster-binding protein [Acidobacteriota bacterium]